MGLLLVCPVLMFRLTSGLGRYSPKSGNNENTEKYQYLGTTSEYSYECGEISGVVSLYWKNSDENLAKKVRLANAVGGDAVAAIEAERKYHEDETSRLLSHLVQALARRLFELVRGGRLHQIMVVQQRSLVQARQEVVQLKRSSELSSAHVSQFQEDLVPTKKELDSLEHQLRIEKQVNLEAIDANKKLAQKRNTKTNASAREKRKMGNRKRENMNIQNRKLKANNTNNERQETGAAGSQEGPPPL